MQIYTLESVTLKQKIMIHDSARDRGLKICLEKDNRHLNKNIGKLPWYERVLPIIDTKR